MTIEEFVALLHDEIGMPVAAEHLVRDLDSVPGWDSMNMVWLVAAMEARTGVRVALPEVLQAGTLRAVHVLYTGDQAGA
ncbi:acyl carrier protein [Dactylosporangium sp. NPDC048998]|uniref:acyl carrier protein n=1 Tax=Dactylosporangium sp. NPDC048998 TaxID=3363976 RepID=UPI0037122CFA